MSPAATALASGFSALLASCGEALVLTGPARGNTPPTVTAVVDRTPDPERYGKVPNFDPHRGSVIELLSSAANPQPRTGEYFRDTLGVNHKIGPVHPFDDTGTLQCFCTAARA